MAKKSKKKIVSMPGLGDIETFTLLPEDEYHVKVVDVEQKEGEKADYLNWELEVVSGEHKGSKLWYITSFAKKSLWNLKAFLEALEADVPEEPEDIPVDDLTGLEIMVTVTHQEYEGKDYAKVTDFAPVDEEDNEDVKVKDEEDDDEAEKYTESQIRDMDEDELKDLVKKLKLDVNFKKLKTAKKKVNAVIAALEEEDLIEEEEDEDE
jgi:hypothetical protein